MSEEEIKKIAKEEFMNNLMEHLDSALIFTYIQELEQKLQQKENIIKEVREYIEKHYTVKKEENIYMTEDTKGLLEILDKENI